MGGHRFDEHGVGNRKGARRAQADGAELDAQTMTDDEPRLDCADVAPPCFGRSRAVYPPAQHPTLTHQRSDRAARCAARSRSAFGLLLAAAYYLILVTVFCQMLDNMLFATYADTHYNTRIKGYYKDGTFVPYELMIASRPVFGSGAELCQFSKDVERDLAYREAAEEIYNGKHCKRGYVSENTLSDNRDSARRRARRKIFDYVICNDWDYFITLTLDSAIINRYNYAEVITKLSSFLGNRVRRHSLAYVGVPELHRKGGLHFHFVIRGGGFRFVDSGTVSVPGHKKPIKRSTAKRLHIPLDDWHTVYNIPEWRYGFSTAIPVYGNDRGALAAYMCKEFCKDVQKRKDTDGNLEKIGGRWYLHGGTLASPAVRLENRSFKDAAGESYALTTDGGDFKVFKLSVAGEVLP